MCEDAPDADRSDAIGFQAALVVQMANLSLKRGRRMRWNAQMNKVEG